MSEPFPDWLRPPPGGFLAEDLDRLPLLPPHTQLLDGSITLAPRPTEFHRRATTFVHDRLRRLAPDGFHVHSDIAVIISPRQRLEPDLLVANAPAPHDRTPPAFRPSEVEAVIEVELPATESRDRERKPEIYAKGKIPFYWRVEDRDGTPVVHVSQLDLATNAYVPIGVYADRVKLGLPFAIDIDLTPFNAV